MPKTPLRFLDGLRRWCLGLLIGVASWQAAAAGPISSLRCTLALAAPVQASGPVLLRMTLHNSGKDPLRVLTWGTPFEAGWLTAWAQLQWQGQPVAYQGAQVKRGEPSADEYLALAAGRKRHASADLAEAFDLTRPGHYELRPQIMLHDVWVQAQRGARPRAQHQPMALPCAGLHFTRPD